MRVQAQYSHRSPYAKGICPEEYEFRCTVADCSLRSHEVEDFFRCESCNALICMEHSHSPQDIPYLRFCATCFRCAQCGELAWAMCEECGDLRCRTHTLGGSERVDDWNMGDITYFCTGECLHLHAKSVERKGVAAPISRLSEPPSRESDAA